MQTGPVFQDWTPVVLTKNKPKKPTDFNPAGNKQFKELDSDDIAKIVYVSKEEADNVIKARNAKNIKQSELAKMCNLDASIIRDFESQKLPSNKKLYNKLLSVLGVKPESNKKPK